MTPARLSEADVTAVRDLAEEILSRPEYARAKAAADDQEWVRWLFDRVGDYLGWLEGLYVTSPHLYWLVLAGLMMILVLLIWHMVWSISRAFRDQEPAPVARETREVDFRAVAEDLAGRGRYLEATHQLLLACLQRAARTGVIELHPEDTNLVARARLQASMLSPPLRAELQELIDATDRVWFRDRHDDPRLYDRWFSAYGELLRETR